VEIDVAAFDPEDPRGIPGDPDHATGTTALWTPVEPTLAVETPLADFDQYEVRVYDIHRDRRLVAAIEIISPANKDRAENRHQFTSKCAALLREGVSLVLVDLVTVRNFNLYHELLQLIGERDPTVGDDPPATYAAACRWQPRRQSGWLETWNRPLTLGLPLPCLPLWLTDDLAISLDLEASYERTCRDLRIA
jgi:hypothetical protein